MLLVRVFCDLGLVDPFDPRPYVKDWHLHRGEERYLAFLLARAHEVATPLPGDVILFKYGRCFSHGGIVTPSDPLTIVHAFHPARVVLEEEIAAQRRDRRAAARRPGSPATLRRMANSEWRKARRRVATPICHSPLPIRCSGKEPQ